ncbi:MAG TPA: hypothetical protein VFK87_06935 [Steroidobacteraceae bacterium]|nr:hypothetical protein [Steroidobacteraceae bacterium]
MGLLLIACVALATPRAQGQAPAPPAPRATHPPVLRMKHVPDPMQDFAGLSYTPEQQAKIDQIHRDTQTRLDTVSRDAKLGPEQKDAMLEGYRRIERAQVFNVLTPEQQRQVRNRALERRTAAQKERQKKQEPQSRP